MEFFKCVPSIRYMAGIVYDSTWAEKFHKSGNHEFLHVLSGKIRLIFQEEGRRREYFASPGESLIVPAGTLHRDDFDFKEDLKVLYVNFSWDAPEFFRDFNNAQFKLLSEETVTEIKMIAERMRFDNVHAGCGQAIENVRLLNILLLFYLDIHPFSTPPASPASCTKSTPLSPRIIAEKAKNYIARNYPEKLHLEDIAEYLNVSKYHFSRVFHASTGFSFRDYLCIYRLNKAKQFLLDEKGSIGEIGEKCGFDNGNYFAKVFKKHFSLSPGKFREEELLKTLKE
ncbi:MAG: AraC family transcriptional regulator [Lentisphaeria bacterium]|nr:AraC family transcriptional regulator [Lentisphaeria bacterium]